MAEVQFSDIIQVAAIGLTLATLKLGLEQFLTQSLLAERQDILNREKEFEIENKAGIDELQETIQHGDKSGETKTNQNLTLYRNTQDALQILDIKESIRFYLPYRSGKGFKISFAFLHVAIVMIYAVLVFIYAVLVFLAAMQLGKMPSIIGFNSLLLPRVNLEYYTVIIFFFTVLTFMYQAAFLAKLVLETKKIRTKLHEYSSELSSLSKQVLADIRLMERVKKRATAPSTP